jgi:hypothetical protein
MSSDKESKALVGLAVLLIAIVSLPIKGWVIARLWGWFLVPVGMVTLTWVEGVAISLIVSLLTFRYGDKPSEKDWPEQLGRALSSPVVSILALLIGAMLRALVER